ncbi:MAG TPA: hypothetical protein VG273_16530 [Bryobacteraceae bacterium]|jgi:hypothetical protein|nr:hypothetical protein [Bryobacteraceae bacterium]
MTWGQLRFSLQTSAPGVSLDLIDEFLNTTYEEILEATDWQGAKYHATIQTTAAYQSTTDSVTATIGSSSVTGTGTAWSSGQIGQKFYIPGDAVIYTIANVSGVGALTLDRGYEDNGVDAGGTVYSGKPYVFMQNVYTLPSDVRSIVSVLDPVSSFPLNGMSKDQLDQSAGPRTLVNDPDSYAPIEDSSESSPPALKQIEFFPPPLHARGMVVEYVHLGVFFDGTSTSGSPLPFVSSSVLLDGARAKIFLHLESALKADRYQRAFEKGRDRILLVEHAQRRVKVATRMAPRFTRHRLERASRGNNNNWGPGAGGPS